MSLRVVSYNLLSPPLASERAYGYCDPAALNKGARMARATAKLAPFVEEGAVICLQEVSHWMRCVLTPYFAGKGYMTAFRNYGGAHSDFMGVALAWPSSLRLEEMKIFLPSNDVPRERRPASGGWSLASTLAAVHKAVLPPLALRAPSFLLHLVLGALRSVRLLPAAPSAGAVREMDEWKLAKQAWNACLACRFRLPGGREVVVATYHMPCKFWQPAMMSIHACILAAKLHKFADGGAVPYVLAGDFNLKPGSGPYKLLTTGALESGDEAVPRVPEGLRWATKLPAPLTSAAVAATGREPFATNHARTTMPWSKPGDPAFTDTLDYIFYSRGLRAVAFEEMPDAAYFAGIESLPTAEEPSDHLLISAELELVDER